MKLSSQIAALVGLAATLLVLVVSLLSVRRELQIIEEDITRDAQMVATSVAAALSNQDESALRDIVQRIDQSAPGLEIRLVPAHPGPASIVQSQDAIRAAVPIAGSTSAIEVSEPLTPRDRLWNASVRSLAWSTVLVMLLSLGAGEVAGRVLVGTRVNALVDAARRVARGQFDQPVEVRGWDELTLLATELNLMSGQLLRAREASNREAEARLEAEVQLRHADRLRTVGQLSAGIAHELGTPLSVISGRAALLLRSLPAHDAGRSHAATIHEQTERITAIVRRLMDFSRRSPSKRREFDLRELITDTITLVRPVLTKLDIEASLAPQCVIQGDREQIRQVVTNLLLNAAQATPSGRVRVGLEVADGFARLAVEDDGPGIPPSDRERVLEPFFTTKQPGEGTGLGLSVVDGIVREHGGTLEIDQSDLGGAAFRVVLPVER